MKKQLKPFKITMILFSVIVISILLYPLVKMIISSFMTSSGDFTLENYKEIFSAKMYVDSFKNSIILSFFSALVGVIFTWLATYSIISLFPKAREKFLVISNLTSNFAGIPLAFAFIILLGNSGVIVLFDKLTGINLLKDFNLYSVSGLLLIFIYFQLPLGITLMVPIFDALDKKWREAAELLGANSFYYWKKIGLPVLAPSLIGIFSIMFANALGAYASAEALTGSSVNLLAIRIGNTVSGDIFARPEIGAALSLVLSIILLVNMLISSWMTKKFRRDL
ncbi:MULTISPECIES: ABC transporter permease subunit [Peptoniphilus]|jgi:ABC transporter, permease protein|uniref:ABC transporter permease n=1 Tax=Peptoniphilus TaxID=162289 RepID=UPI0002893A46|nr:MULTISPECIES: ABC transporter permease subunit [Peptoniphilus]MBS6610884.1 ABC transporter permease [Peptoniphilus harei]MDU1954746.1 ABC transporter permease [Peptoniphilus lacydonensis]MDU5275090.1 ABC transporter permease [Peptoniphilus lacydonensis]MDU5377234.1 ABC transporter permease [Peptoniphilus lacydonensis]MDU5436819.1 ABC transporter permease [Peptoniphilus lacydonensis]